MRHLMAQLNQGIAECDELLSQNEMFLARTKGIGAVSAEDALDFGITGPALRASGVPEDVRISEPYSIYDRFDRTSAFLSAHTVTAGTGIMCAWKRCANPCESSSRLWSRWNLGR